MVKKIKRSVPFALVLFLCLALGWLVFRAFASPMVPSGGGGGTGSLPGALIALGEVDGSATFNVFGKNPDLNADTEETLWNQGGIYAFPTAARIHSIVSTDADDDGNPAGNGARTVYIEGLDSSFDIISETKTLEGLTPVATSNSYLRVHRLVVMTSGSSGTNEGTITATAAVDATVSAAITPGDGQQSQLVFTVPNEKKAVLASLFWCYAHKEDLSPSEEIIKLKLKIRPFGMSWRTLADTSIDGKASSWSTYTFQAPLVFDPKTDIKIEGTASADTLQASGTMDLFLIDQ